MLYPVTKSGWTRGAAQDQCSTSFFPLTYFPLRSKVAVRNSLFMSDFAPPVNSLNAPSIPLAGQVEHSYAAHRFSRRSLQVGRSICLTESYGNNSFSLKANAVHCVCVWATEITIYPLPPLERNRGSYSAHSLWCKIPQVSTGAAQQGCCTTLSPQNLWKHQKGLLIHVQGHTRSFLYEWMWKKRFHSLKEVK